MSSGLDKNFLALMARLHFDEDADMRLAKVLRRCGYDVTTTPEVSLLSASDEDQLAYAASQGRALVTRNIEHFPDLCKEWFEQGREHWGIIVTIRPRPVGEMLVRMERLLNRYEAKELCNRIFFLGRSGP
jgi:predicted nuclease of predicted toxin-antitoxin system